LLGEDTQKAREAEDDLTQEGTARSEVAPKIGRWNINVGGVFVVDI